MEEKGPKRVGVYRCMWKKEILEREKSGARVNSNMIKILSGYFFLSKVIRLLKCSDLSNN